MKTAAETSDTVGHVIAILGRYPEVATIASHPATGTVVLSFIVRRRLDPAAREAIRDEVVEHVRSLVSSCGSEPQAVTVKCELDDLMTFVRVGRDVHTLCREELAMLTALFGARFGEALLRSPIHEDFADDDPTAGDEAVECAIEALRDPAHQKSLVGFREEKRVLVYFLRTRKKAKAAAR